MRKQLLFITTSSLAANPRLVKEFESLKQHYSCTVLCFKHHDWSLSLSEEIKTRNEEVDFIEIDRKKSVKETILSKIVHKLAITVNPLLQNNFKISAFASNDKTAQLYFRVKKLRNKHQFDTVIAHNLGAFYPAVKICQFQNTKLQLDIEDFYPEEALYFNKKYEKANRYLIMQSSFNVAKNSTYASKGIEIECKKRFKLATDIKHTTIINAFAASDFLSPKSNSNENIKCVWFSQNIGPNRGLEQVFETAKANSEIEFHIIGNANSDYLKTKVISSNIKFHTIMTQTKLHQFLSTMDIGLALESKDADFNRDICLTNKILAYAQAGLYILATDTFGQRDFLKGLEYKAGELISADLNETLLNLDDAVFTFENKQHRWKNAKALSWEEEQKKLVKLL